MIVDVRGASSYNGGHVPFATTRLGMLARASKVKSPKLLLLQVVTNMPIGTICQTAAAARQNLKDAGFKCVRQTDWEAAGIELNPEGS